MESLRLRASLDNLASFREFVIAQAERAFPDSEKLPQKLDLALEEVLVNVISYAYPDGDGDVEVACGPVDGAGGQRFALAVADWGGSFDPLDRRGNEPDTSLELDDRKPGGLGIFFIRHVTTGMEYSREGDANRLTLYFAP